MTPAEIIRAHAQNQGQNPDMLATQMQKFLAQPHTRVVREGDCLFLIKTENKVGYFFIVNGGNTTGYMRALKMFVEFMRKLAYKKIAMRVQDDVQSKRIATSAGVKSVEYKDVGGKSDPYLMTMEL